MTELADLRFELNPAERQLVELYGIDDYVCCYEGTSPDDLWYTFIIEGARELADRMDPFGRRAEGFTLVGDDLVFAYETLESMSSDSPLDGCDEGTRQLAFDLLERLDAVISERRHEHWVRIYDEREERDRQRREAEEARALRERQLRDGLWKADVEPGPGLRPSGLV